MDAAFEISGTGGRPPSKPLREGSSSRLFSNILNGQRRFGKLSVLSFFELSKTVVGANDKR